jgi:two-component system LytT family response regulator
MMAFVSRWKEFAVEAFEMNALDYLVTPLEAERLRVTLRRARALVTDRNGWAGSLAPLAAMNGPPNEDSYLERLPLRRSTEVVIVPVSEVVSIVARGEHMHITTTKEDCFTIPYRLHALERRLDPKRFVRLNRAALANVDLIRTIRPVSGGTYTAVLSNGQELPVSRIQAKLLRATLLHL